MNLKIKARNTSASAQLKRSRRKKIRKSSEWIEQNSPRSIHHQKKNATLYQLPKNHLNFQCSKKQAKCLG